MAPLTDQTMRLQLPTDRLVLAELQGGRNLSANISDEIDRHQKTVSRRVNQLEDYGLVNNIGRGVYEITEKGEVALRLIDRYDEVDDFEGLVESELKD